MIQSFTARLLWPLPACIHQFISDHTGWAPQLTFDRQLRQAARYAWTRTR